jgi:UDP-N-acetylmuramate dehydrogenase
VDELAELYNRFPQNRKLILGGGTNLLFTKDFDGLVLKNEIKGMELVSEDSQYVYVRAGGGENWHGLVLYSLQRNWQGLENLSLIPGSVGAAPIQNIGAYGVELKDFLYELEAFDTEENKTFEFSVNDCELSYRDSVFKNRYRNRFVILNVTFRLNKIPKFHASYDLLAEELNSMGVEELSAKKISLAVIHIRTSRLPDPAIIGNAGSFFKNPVLSILEYKNLKKINPLAPGFPQTEGFVKLPAAWLIEQCGWKGYRLGDAGCHVNQPLVLVNYGKASGREIFELSEKILASVKAAFGIVLEREVNII